MALREGSIYEAPCMICGKPMRTKTGLVTCCGVDYSFEWDGAVVKESLTTQKVTK